MERHNYLRLNPKKYEQNLSTFGNKVLSVLVKQWDKARTQNNNEYHRMHRQFHNQENKVFTFNDDSIGNSPSYTPPLILPARSEEVSLKEKSFNLDLLDKTIGDIPTSVNLIKTIPKPNDKYYDFRHPTIAANKNLVNNIYHKDSESFDDDDDTPNLETIFNANTNESKGNYWDDMLDPDLFDNIATNERENREIVDDNDDIQVFNKFASQDVILSKNFDSINGNKSQTNKVKKRKKVNNTELTVKKVRSDCNVENQQKQKTSVRQADKKINFRKQMYTKAVKNWLINVEQNNPVDEDVCEIVNKSNVEENKTDECKSNMNSAETKTHFHQTRLTHKEKNIINKTINTAKKVVQAQLANKDGVMKFSKPKHNGGENKNSDIKENKPKDSKDKKVKRFVAPIKSQIPVKDVVYEMSTIDEDNLENYRELLQEIKNKEIFAVLTYSNGFCQLNNHHTDGACAPDGVIVSNDDMFYCFKSADKKLKETLKYLLEHNKIVCYDARNVLIYFATHLEMEIHSINMCDVKIGANLLDPDNPPENFTDLQKLLSFTAQYTIATECTLQKCAWYMSLLKECWVKLYGLLIENSLWKVFVDIEMKLLPIIANMERRGVAIDLVKLNSMEEVLLTKMKLVEQQCYEAAGKVFQINSAVQVRAILYDELELDTKCNVKIRETICKGAKSTSETMLRSLVSEHPLPKLILEYRHLHKAHATFLSGIAQHAKDGVVRPTWVQTAAATGRIASSNPNLQAVPRAPFSLVLFPDASGTDSEQLMFRSVYVSRTGYSLVAADFKHVECRVFAHAAADTRLLHALTTSDDLFKVLAARWLRKPEAEIVSEERERTKRLVYASLYGAGMRKLMEILDVDYQQALQVTASFNRTFPSLKSFGRGVVSRCEQAGGRLATLCGRMRRFSNIASEDFASKSHAERQAVKFVVQGSAADLCKIAMILTEERLRTSSPPVDAHLILQIHDELVWEVDDQHVARASVIIKEVMEGCGRQCGMVVTLPVAVSVGKDWGHME